MLKIGLVSHRGGNIGHDMMAVGVEAIIEATFGLEIKIVHFEQHRPFCIYPKGHWLHLVDKLPHGRLKMLRRILNNEELAPKLWKMAKEDIGELNGVIACGGPNIVPPQNQSVEMGLMLHHLLGAFAIREVPVFDFGIGAAFPLEDLPEKYTDRESIKFYQRLFSYCVTNTVRDRLAQKLCAGLGRDCPLIPCPAFVSGLYFEKFKDQFKVPEREKYLVINFQVMGANTDWGQGVNKERWRKIVQELVVHLKRRHPIAFLCHNETEYNQAREVDPDLPRWWPKTISEYIGFMWRIKGGVVSRIHAAIPLASIGISTIVIGTDSRLGAVDLIGLTNYYVKNATAEMLECGVEESLVKQDENRQRLVELRKKVLCNYADILNKYIKY